MLGSLGEQLPPIFGGTLDTSITKSKGKHRFHRSEAANSKLPNMIAEAGSIMIDATSKNRNGGNGFTSSLMSSLLMLVGHFNQPCSFPVD